MTRNSIYFCHMAPHVSKCKNTIHVKIFKFIFVFFVRTFAWKKI